jgi:pimeloyl-ACP methyl ester carboxylesterase
MSAGLLLAGARAKAELRAENPPPGTLVDIGGYELHLHCEGQGSPTVILEAGAGGFSSHWVYVQDEVTQFTRVCAYDRAGLGWSEASPRPRTADVVVEELHALLTAAGVAEPYVLVGHSLGGVFVRRYAHEFPNEVEGIVLVDSAHPEQDIRAPAALREWTDDFQAQQARQLTVVGWLTAGGIMALTPETIPGNPALPAETDETIKAVIASNPSYFRAASATRANLGEIFAQARAAQITLDDMPLRVIAAGQPLTVDPALGLTEPLVAQYRPYWRELQRDLAELSTRGDLTIAEESGHDIHIEQPQIVVDAIREVVEAASAQEARQPPGSAPRIGALTRQRTVASYGSRASRPLLANEPPSPAQPPPPPIRRVGNSSRSFAGAPGWRRAHPRIGALIRQRTAAYGPAPRAGSSCSTCRGT